MINNILLLIGDDVAAWEKVAVYLKNKKNFVVFTAYKPGDAYKILRKEPISIVVSDYMLPKLISIAFLKKMKSLKPHIELIFLSAEANLTNAIEAMKAGAYDFYELPVNMRLLFTVISKAIEKQSLFSEKVELEKKVLEMFKMGSIVGRSKPMQRVIDVVSTLAPKNVNVLITGETGTGKEMIANALHYNSARATKPFVKINCASFNKGVLESELFGHEVGAFTGAVTNRIGRFELANGGTIFLDEVGDIPMSTQIKLLRVLQEKQIERVGGNDTITIDVRVLAATNKNLTEIVAKGKFREDLYYRLNVVHIPLPSLMERKDDIPLLVSYFINKLNEEKSYNIIGISKESMQMLSNYKWPGNVRELENTVEAAMALAKKQVIESKYLPSFLLLAKPEDSTFYQIPKNISLDEMEKEIISQTLIETRGNKTKAAKILKIGLRTLQRKVSNRN